MWGDETGWKYLRAGPLSLHGLQNRKINQWWWTKTEEKGRKGGKGVVVRGEVGGTKQPLLGGGVMAISVKVSPGVASWWHPCSNWARETIF